MKLFTQILAFTAIVSIPSVLMAQTSSSSFTPASPFAQPFKEISKSDLKLLPLPNTGSRQQSSFMSHLPSILPDVNTNFIIDHLPGDPAYYYNMPIVKPRKTSKILIAKLDANSPYSYNMPVKKVGIIKK